MEPLRSPSYEVADAFEANELFQRNGWTDGLPIVPAHRAAGAAVPRGGRPGRRRGRRRRAGAAPPDHRREGRHRRGDGRVPAGVPAGGGGARARPMCEPEFGLHGVHREHRRQRAVRRGERPGAARARHERHPQRPRQRQPRQRDDRPRAAAAHHQRARRASRASSTARPSVTRASSPSAWPRTRRTARGCRWPPSVACRRAPPRSRCWRSESPHQVMNEWTHDPREIAETYAAAIRANMLTYSIWAGNYALVVPKQQRQIFAEAGWSKTDLREYVYERARVTRREWRTVGKSAVAPRKDEDAVYTALRSPDDLLVDRGRRPGGRIRRDPAAVVRQEVAGRDERNLTHDASRCSTPGSSRRGRGGAPGRRRCASLDGAAGRPARQRQDRHRALLRPPRGDAARRASACARSSGAASPTRAARRRPSCSGELSARRRHRLRHRRLRELLVVQSARRHRRGERAASRPSPS